MRNFFPVHEIKNSLLTQTLVEMVDVYILGRSFSRLFLSLNLIRTISDNTKRHFSFLLNRMTARIEERISIEGVINSLILVIKSDRKAEKRFKL